MLGGRRPFVVGLSTLVLVMAFGPQARASEDSHPKLTQFQLPANLAAKRVTLPAVVCPTTNRVPHAPAKLPRVSHLGVPASEAPSLAVYSDNLGQIFVLAPRHWSCGAEIQEDGREELVVVPHGSAIRATTSFHRQKWSGVVVSETSACFGCTLDQACPLFASAASLEMSSFGTVCPHARPSREEVRTESATAKLFEDPAGVPGEGNPSGGTNTAEGELTYNASSDNGSWVETCTLPASMAKICVATISVFNVNYGAD